MFSSTSCLPLISLSVLMHLYSTHFLSLYCLPTILCCPSPTLLAYIAPSLNLLPHLPTYTNGQRPSLVPTGLDDFEFSFSIVTQVSPVPTELYNWIYVFLPLTEFYIYLSVRFSAHYLSKKNWVLSLLLQIKSGCIFTFSSFNTQICISISMQFKHFSLK